MEKKMLFIYNPHAGKARIRSNLLDMIDIFTKAGYEVTAYPTQKRGDAVAATMNRADAFQVLACSGGDGTLDEVVTGMMTKENRIPIGYVPAGTTNDFAKSLGISSNMLRAARGIVEGSIFSSDVGHFNDDIFVYIAAFGIFTEVSYITNQQAKNLLGHLAYVLEGAKRINNIPSYHIKYSYEEIQDEGDFLFGMITNSISVGGFSKITGKNVKLDDGLFEVTLIKTPRNMMDLNMILASLVSHKINPDHMICFKTDKLLLEFVEKIPWTLDGEYGGKHKRVIIENEKQGLQIIVPLKH